MPMHFRETVLLYSLTRSRLALSLLGGGSPYGSYQTVKTWLRADGVPRQVEGCVQEWGVLAVFDNNQVLQRRWQISQHNTVKSSTITMVSFMEMPRVNLMFNPSFSPAEWMWSKFPVDGLQQLFDREKAGRRFLYEHHLHSWLTDIICEVAYEQIMASSGEFTDPVDKNVEENRHKENFKTCPNCGDRNMPRRNRLCRASNTTISAARF